ncbi:MAG: DUF3696 domain-containing protein [Bacteroidia bacterium]|nr:DUF3696 domain-containing protein [Bacteroidia bacterium]
MITRLYIKNFKSLRAADLALTYLNLLTGLNGSGKSSLIQTLLLLRQSKAGLEVGKLMLRLPDSPFELFDAGLAGDVYYSLGAEPEICFHLNFSDRARLEWNFRYQREQNEHDDVLEGAQPYASHELNTCAIFNDQFQYLFAERQRPRDSYAASSDNVLTRKTLGIYGEHTPYYLHIHGLQSQIEYAHLQHPKAKSEQLLYQADAWLREISPGVGIQTALAHSKEEVDLRYEYGVYAYKPKNVGFGLSYVLPVIVSLLTARPGKLILIENPESHIHPRGQVELGRLLAAAVQTGAQLIIETHSDHILNGIRIAVREQLIAPEQAAAFFFKRNDEEYASEITHIGIDDKGKLYRHTPEGKNARLPKDFFDNWTTSMSKLL